MQEEANEDVGQGGRCGDRSVTRSLKVPCTARINLANTKRGGSAENLFSNL